MAILLNLSCVLIKDPKAKKMSVAKQGVLSEAIHVWDCVQIKVWKGNISPRGAKTAAYEFFIMVCMDEIYDEGINTVILCSAM
jgi:hypothetical protein